MAVYKTSNSGLLTRREYTSFLAGNDKFIPSFAVGAYDSIATVNIGSGGASSVTFSSIPATYKHLQLRATAKTTFTTYAGNGINVYFNSDYSSAKYTHQLYGSGSGAAAAQAVPNYMNVSYIPGNQSGSTNMYGPVILDILDYSSSSKNKTFRSLAGWDNNGSGLIVLNSGFNGATSAINEIILNPDSGTNFMQYSQFALYGIKGQ